MGLLGSSQNEIAVTLLLLMLAIIPNNANSPPRFWMQNRSPPDKESTRDPALIRARENALAGRIRAQRVNEKAGLKIRGLLGLNFLKNYRLTIDFPTRQLELTPPRGT